MPVICLLNQKGGVGKTTLALNLAAAFALDGEAVLYVDADPQSTALDWSTIRQGSPVFNVVSMPRNTLHTQLPTLGANYRWTLIDGPPLAGDVAKSAILASDLIVILCLQEIQNGPIEVTGIGIQISGEGICRRRTASERPL